MRRLLGALLALLLMIPQAQALDATLSVNLSLPASGNPVALPTAFGLGAYSGSSAFATMQNAAWQATVNSLPGFGLFRSNPNTLGDSSNPSSPQGVWPTAGAFPGSPNWSAYNSFWLGLKQLGSSFTGRAVIGMGIKIPSWMSISSSTDAATFGQMAVKIAQQVQIDAPGLTNVYFEAINEPEGQGYSAANAAMYANAVANALKGAGFTYPVGGPVIANAPTGSHAGYAGQFATTMGTANLGFLDYHMYGVGTTDDPCFVAGDGNIRANNALGTGTLGSSYGYDAITKAVRQEAVNVNAAFANVPMILGEYNLYGEYIADGKCPNSGASDFESQTNVAAVFAANVLIKAISGANLQMSAMWHAYEDLPNLGETYGVFNGASVDNNSGNNYPAWHVYPPAYAVSYMYKYLPGNVITTTTSNGGLNLSQMGTFNPAKGTFGEVIVNYNTGTTYTVAVSVSSAPTSADYTEISANCNYTSVATFKTSCTALKSAAQLAAGLVIPPMSVVILGSPAIAIPPPLTATNWNLLDASASITLSNSNLTAANAAVAQGVRTNASYTTGKKCFDVRADTITASWQAGISSAAYSLVDANGLGGQPNGIAFSPNAGTGQEIFTNGGAPVSAGASPSVNGEIVTTCADLGSEKEWVTSSVMRAAGHPWNNDILANQNPATGVGGIPFSTVTCPCFPTFAVLSETTGQATLNAKGPFAVAMPTGFQAWQPPGNHVMMINLGANDNVEFRKVASQ